MTTFTDKDVTATEQFVFFWRGWPSQWGRTPFTHAGITYNCCEQYMMAEKARIFGDKETLQTILAAISPKEQKALGREVRGFDEAIWNSVCRGIVYTGNLAKFQDHRRGQPCGPHLGHRIGGGQLGRTRSCQMARHKLAGHRSDASPRDASITAAGCSARDAA